MFYIEPSTHKSCNCHTASCIGGNFRGGLVAKHLLLLLTRKACMPHRLFTLPLPSLKLLGENFYCRFPMQIFLGDKELRAHLVNKGMVCNFLLRGFCRAMDIVEKE